MKSRLLHVLFWMVIAAAFIGPGTVTTAAAAGANHGFSLLWALLFSMLACIVLQESAARVAITTGLSLGQVVLRRFQSKKLAWFLAVAVFLGCAAYEAGNILGAISGIALVTTDIKPAYFTWIIVIVAFVLLWFGKIKTVVNAMGILVAVMGFAFLVAGLSQPIDLPSFTHGLLVPQLPEGSIVLTLGLVGTTIVPYNIFMGAGLAKGQEVKQMRFGLTMAIVLGGVISMGILIIGTSVEGIFSFQGLAQGLKENVGGWMAVFFAIGLFAAGFTSGITAPMAAAITLKSVANEDAKWQEKGTYYRLAWIVVLLAGLFFGITQVKPVPIIILAQAANGFILPVIAIFLWIVVNSKPLLGHYQNSAFLNIAMGVTVYVTSLLGLINIFKAGYAIAGENYVFDGYMRYMIFGIGAIILLTAIIYVAKERHKT